MAPAPNEFPDVKYLHFSQAANWSKKQDYLKVLDP